MQADSSQYNVFPPTWTNRVVDTAFLQQPPNPRHHSLSAFWQNLPERCKVGDTLTAKVVDLEGKDVSDNVTFQWYADDKAIEGADEETLVVDDDLIGAALKVVVTAENGNTFESDETEEVGVYEALEILSAEQIKKDQVYVTFSAPISLLDDITVTKGSAEKTVSAVLPDDDNLGATLTMKDALATGTYTVTLTPADEDEDPSSVTFEAKVANKAARIEILSDYLVMKDTNFQEGYCFIKGYNDFDEEVILSGLTVNAAPSSSVQYDASTGKLTVKSNQPNQYAIIKQVTVYAQAMVDSKAIVAQKTLEVSSIGYPAEVEFGEITKDATNVPDISDGITINEINSGLYYIPILSVKDNYGNDMLAKDLNDLDQKNLLTTVPTNDTSLYFSVRPEGSVFTEKNGQIVIFLNGGNGKPGTFNFLMTSAGGQFEKEVKIIENPFISTLNVTLPDIYEYEETDEFGLVGYDQDGKELDLYDYLQAGETLNKLNFIDQQNLTESNTVIDAGTGNGTWRVQKFADTKTYKVTFVPSDQVKAKGIITFVTTTADFHTDTQMATVGSRGTSGYIGSELKSAATVTYDFNKNLRFFDANGKEMDRAHNEKYPTFVLPTGTKVTASLLAADTVNLTDEKIAAANHDGDDTNDFAFYYVVSNDDKDLSVPNQEAVTQNAGPKKDGEVNAAAQYYVYLIANQAVAGNHDLTVPARNRIIDSRSFYVSNKQQGDVPVSYTAKVNNKLYTGDKYDDDVAITVDVTYRNGVVKTGLAATGLSLDGGFKVKDNTISKGTAKGDGTATVSVYLASVTGDENSDGVLETYYNDGAVATCTLTYSDDDPVGTSVDFKRYVQPSNYGTTWDEGETETVWDLKKGITSAITVKDGVLTMTKGNIAEDTYIMKVKDQYGEVMSNAKYYINGKQILKSQRTEKAAADAVKVLEIKGQSKGSEVSKTWRVNVPVGTTVTSKDDTTTVVTSDITVTTDAELQSALTAANAGTPLNITLGNSIIGATAVTIPGGSKLIVPEGKALTMANNQALTVTGKLVNNGVVTLGTDSTVTATTGEITNNGTFNGGAHKLTVNGKFINDGTFTGTGTIEGSGTYTNNEGATTNLGTATGKIDMSQAHTLENAGTVIAHTISGYVKVIDSAAITVAANTYNATTIVPSGVTATITNKEESPSKTAVIAGTGATGIVVSATNINTMTAVSGTGSVKDGDDEKATTVNKGLVAKMQLEPKTEQADLWENAVVEVGGTLDAKAKAQGAGTIGWLALGGMDSSKYYYFVLVSTNITDGELVTMNAADGSYKEVMKFHGKSADGFEWNNINGVGGSLAATAGRVNSINVYVSDTDIDAAIEANCTKNTAANWQAKDGSTLAKILTDAGATVATYTKLDAS